jgi:hypothetical protein
MGELWWAEAVIPKDRQPDWAAAHQLISELRAPEIRESCPEYINEIPDQALRAAGIPVPVAGLDVDDLVRFPKLVGLVQFLVHADLEQISTVLASGRPRVCAFESAGLRIFVHESGYSSGDPDLLCDRWLRLQNIGAFERAGFLPTAALDGGC